MLVLLLMSDADMDPFFFTTTTSAIIIIIYIIIQDFLMCSVCVYVCVCVCVCVCLWVSLCECAHVYVFYGYYGVSLLLIFLQFLVFPVTALGNFATMVTYSTVPVSLGHTEISGTVWLYASISLMKYATTL